MTKIYIKNNQKEIAIDSKIRKIARHAIVETLKSEGVLLDTEISLIFEKNPRIHELNLNYRGVDRPTDVLSFPLFEPGEIDFKVKKDEIVALGDIIISPEKAAEQAAEYGHSFEHEIAFLCVHSTLHLLFYDHEKSDEEDKIVNEKQDKIIEILRKKLEID